jgi:hypothetical protein
MLKLQRSYALEGIVFICFQMKIQVSMAVSLTMLPAGVNIDMMKMFVLTQVVLNIC